jgi:hypothetical protein
MYTLDHLWCIDRRCGGVAVCCSVCDSWNCSNLLLFNGRIWKSYFVKLLCLWDWELWSRKFLRLSQKWLWIVTAPHGLLKVNWRFAAVWCHHLQGGRINQTRDHCGKSAVLGAWTWSQHAPGKGQLNFCFWALRAGPLYPRKILGTHSVRGWIYPRVIVRLEGLGTLRDPVISSGIEPATFRLVTAPHLTPVRSASTK